MCEVAILAKVFKKVTLEKRPGKTYKNKLLKSLLEECSQKQEELQSCSLWNKKPHSQKDRQDEKAEGYVPDEGTR